MPEHIVVPLWMQQPKDIRDQIALDFDLPRTGITEVMDDAVVRDGYSEQDLMHLTHEKMAAYVGSDESFLRLWELTCAKARSILNPPAVVMTSADGVVELEAVEEVVVLERPEPAPKAETKPAKKPAKNKAHDA